LSVVRRLQSSRRSTSGTAIDPEDGLFQGMKELQEKLGQKKFMEMLLEKFPPKDIMHTKNALRS
jgi:hypothetical protein